eukprot:4941792-Pleurochrysis_carterae.AAC.2
MRVAGLVLTAWSQASLGIAWNDCSFSATQCTLARHGRYAHTRCDLASRYGGADAVLMAHEGFCARCVRFIPFESYAARALQA